jgi:hypothetical protein
MAPYWSANAHAFAIFLAWPFNTLPGNCHRVHSLRSCWIYGIIKLVIIFCHIQRVFSEAHGNNQKDRKDQKQAPSGAAGQSALNFKEGM